MDLAGLARHLERAAVATRPRIAVALEEAGVVVAEAAKEMIGHQHPEWPPLAASTLERKGANTPLLETGEMRESIRAVVDPEGLELAVGSNNAKAVWHELGTEKIPPRPFLSTAAHATLPAVTNIIGNAAVETLTPGARRR